LRLKLNFDNIPTLAKSVTLSPTTFRIRVLASWAGLLVAASCFAADEVKVAELERPRTVQVIYGWDAEVAEKPAIQPIDTMAAELFQAPLEYLGYECHYTSVTQPLPQVSSSKTAAVMLDGELHISMADQAKVANWLAAAKSAGVPVLITGAFPFSDEEALGILRDKLGLRGTLLSVKGAEGITVLAQPGGDFAGEVKAQPSRQEFRDLQGPASARVLLSLGAKAAQDNVLFTPIFLADWGGCWLEPFVIQRASQDSYLFYAEPYLYLQQVFAKAGPFPAPDATTRDGKRMFYSHIDGDGFASSSQFKDHPFCGEVVRDRILKVYPFPVTVSVIEGEINGDAFGVDRAAVPRLKAAAKDILAMPHIQAGSHSYAHPYQWDETDANPGEYDSPCMKLKPDVAYQPVDLQRELRGSVDFINRELMPPGRSVEIFLWSGNTRPGAKALSMLKDMNLENMNGGNTIISRLYPGIAGVAPRIVEWGNGQLQINAANQNEFMYANGWQGPFYGGFAEVVDTFERTELPRRLKPVNVYYHFYSAMNLSSTRALEKIHRWCMEQPLHPVTALEYAKIVRDAHRTTVTQKGRNHWVLQNQGDCRSYRLPKDIGEPDMKRSSGVTGWVAHGDSIFIHTSGQPRTEIVLAANAAEPPAASQAHLRMESSTAEVFIQRMSQGLMEFDTRSALPGVVELAGLPAGQSCTVTTNGQSQTLTADPLGHVTLDLPSQAHVLFTAHLPHALLPR
jgi:polysaccharide biosynthesis protein PelA